MINKNKPWSEADLVILRSEVASGRDIKATARLLQRHQTEVASKIFEINTQDHAN